VTKTHDTFPFGAPSTPRPPRPATGGRAQVAVVGVYPSALHVRWDVPQWAVQRLGLAQRVGALAVDVEPTVFWDGIDPDPDELVAAWQQAVGFQPGDDELQHGQVRPVMNGTSGRTVAERVLGPLGVTPAATSFTDVTTRFYVKSGSPRTAQQADRIRDVYAPFAMVASLPPARLPARPTPRQLVADAVGIEGGRLRSELADAAAATVVTLGDEARTVLARIADEVAGPPSGALRRDDAGYGQPGHLRLGGYRAQWYALTHPGNRNAEWSRIQDRWAAEVRRPAR
jgi:hypothetical protein